MPYSMLDDPTRWRERVEEARSIAEQLNEPESSRIASPSTQNAGAETDRTHRGRRADRPGGVVVVRTPGGPNLTYRLAIACDDNGMPSHRLRHRRCDASVFLNAFDLIELKGDDLRFRSTRDKSLCD
jgi:hypothetical protein